MYTLNFKHVNDPVASSSGDTDSSYEWALCLWWERWFPEVLQEYKEIVAAYSTSKTSYTLNYRGVQRGGGGASRCVLQPKTTKKDYTLEEK